MLQLVKDPSDPGPQVCVQRAGAARPPRRRVEPGAISSARVRAKSCCRCSRRQLALRVGSPRRSDTSGVGGEADMPRTFLQPTRLKLAPLDAQIERRLTCGENVSSSDPLPFASGTLSKLPQHRHLPLDSPLSIATIGHIQRQICYGAADSQRL
jgi:hypothetical protein